MDKSKHQLISLLAILTIYILFLSACAQTPLVATISNPGTTPEGTDAKGFDLPAALASAGGKVDRTGAVEQPFFNVKGERLSVNGAEIQVFSFPDQKSREAVSGLISPDGSTIGTHIMNWATVPNFWAKENLIVLYLGNDPEVIGLLNRTLGSAMTGSPADGVIEGTTGPESAAINAVLKDLSQKLNIRVGDIRMLSFEQVDWPDTCLGNSQIDISCAMVVTPGWQIILEAGSQQYEYHTDLKGEKISLVEEGANLDFGLDLEVPPPVASAVEKLSDALSVSKDTVEVKSYEAVSWPDSCLGLARPGEMCLQVITPGYKVQLEAGGKSYEVHTDQRGANSRIKGFGGTESPGSSIDRSKAVMAAVRKLSETTGIGVGDINVISSGAVDWPDACLGLAQAGEACAQSITPGWRIVLETGGQQYEIRADQKGDQLRMADHP